MGSEMCIRDSSYNITINHSAHQTKPTKPSPTSQQHLHNFSVSLLLNINLGFSFAHLLLPDDKSIRAVRPSNQGTIYQEKIPGEFHHRLKPKTALY